MRNVPITSLREWIRRLAPAFLAQHDAGTLPQRDLMQAMRQKLLEPLGGKARPLGSEERPEMYEGALTPAQRLELEELRDKAAILGGDYEAQFGQDLTIEVEPFHVGDEMLFRTSVWMFGEEIRRWVCARDGVVQP